MYDVVVVVEAVADEDVMMMVSFSGCLKLEDALRR